MLVLEPRSNSTTGKLTLSNPIDTISLVHSSAMADEAKEGKCDWAPLTPEKFVQARYEVNSTGIGLNHGVENPKLSQIWGKLGYDDEEKDQSTGNCGCDEIGKFADGNCGGGEGRCGVAARKVGFMVSENPSSSSRLEFLGLNGKPEGIMVGISDKRPHQETIELEAPLAFGSDSTKASNEAKNETPKRRTQGKKRLKMKRHRPKVFDKTKTKKKSSTPTKPMKPSTPKPRTPKRPKLVKKNSPDDKASVEQPSKTVDRELAGDSNIKTCRRKLHLDIENCTMNQNPEACDEMESKPEVETKLQQSGIRCSPLRVYTRIFKPNECLKNSRKLGPNCPSVFKKARMRRSRATALDKLIELVTMIPTTRKRKRAAMNEPRNLDQIIRDRKTKPRTLLGRRKEMTREAVKHWTFKKCTRDLTWIVRRKRLKTSFRKKRDSSSFVSDLSKLQLSETFLSKASIIRTKYTGPDKEAQDKVIQNLDKKEWIVQQELPHDNMVSCNGSIQKCHADFEDHHMLGVEMDIPEHNSNIDVDDMFNYRPEKPSDSDVKTPSLVDPFDEEEEEEEDVSSSQDCDPFKKALVDFASQMMEGLNINVDSDGFNQLVVRNQNGALIPSKEKFKQRQQVPKVRVFNLLMGNSENKDEDEDDDDEKAKYWKEERALFEGRLKEFIAILHLIQGDRRFSPWKGSVVDSVVGVFLTQNVSDHLSSSAFMSLAAKYPALSVSENNGSDEHKQLLTIENDPISSCTINQIRAEAEAEAEAKDGNKNCFSQTESTPARRKGKNENKRETVNWDELRVKYSQAKIRTDRTADSVNWEAVRQASVNEVAKVIMERGMNNLLAARIKDFLDRIVRDHSSIDLEWLRDVPPEKAKEYLLSISGLGLKSVECVRLLTLHHQAFPVDVNISRVTTRFAWIPLHALPKGVLIHLLNQYPDLDSVQQFLWPRLKHLPHAILYEAHYHLILFGKTICTKKKPNCGACPFRAKCKHYASMCASARLCHEGSYEQNMATQSLYASSQESMVKTSPPMLPNSRNCEPIIEMPDSPVHECTPEMDVDACTQSSEDIEDFGLGDEMPTLKLGLREREDDESKALVAVRHEVATHLRRKLKTVDRLRTEHHVYELPDSHPLLAGFEKRELEDPCHYLLAIWMTDETTNSCQDPKKANNCQESTNCDTCTCSGEIVKYQNEQTVQGTILIPCRTANRGSFPLNGTYFQVNEVFADHESSRQPIDVPREWVWNLRRRALYCGTSVQSICRDMLTEEIRGFFWRGSICIRGFDKTSRGPKPLAKRFHICKTRQVDKNN